MNVDYVVVGQGLAGSVLAHRLLEAGHKVIVIDDHYRSSSSKVAAGIINPVTGKRLAALENTRELLLDAKAMYQELMHAIPIIRILKDEQERELFEKRKELNSYKEFLGDYFPPETHPQLADPYGSIEILQGAYLDVPAFLNRMLEYLQLKGAYLQLDFDHDLLKVESDSIHYQGITAKKIIFCEGYKVIENPYFKHLDWAPAKGEILDVTLSEDVDTLVNKTQWLLPTKKGVYKIGSNFDWDDLSNTPSDSVRDQILESVQSFVNVDMECVKHQAGVRPSTKSARPYIGCHSDHPSVAVFNGFGSRGSMLIPSYSKQMIDRIIQKIKSDL